MNNPIEAAVLPLKTDAMASAVEGAQEQIARVHAALEAAGWDLDVAAPPGNSLRDSRETYRAKMAKHNFFTKVTKWTQSSRRPSDPNIVAKSVDREVRYMAEVAEFAAAQYDMFVAKLVGKIGETTEATLTGSHVWGYSHLTVVKADGSKETWRTQQILNQSVYGKIFNQWPSRKVKAAA